MALFGICSQAVVLDHAVKTNQQRTTHLCPFSRGHPQACWTKKKKNLSVPGGSVGRAEI